MQGNQQKGLYRGLGLIISKQTLRRLPVYLNYLKTLPEDASGYISATAIANALDLNQVQVRKDLAAVSSSGRPKVGYVAVELIYEIEEFLGFHTRDNAIIVGAGKLGRALMNYDEFERYGLTITAAFDTDPATVGVPEAGIPVLPMEQLPDYCSRTNIRIGFITVPAKEAQAVCDILVKSGIRAIWNFTTINLKAPKDVLVHSENMASSFAMLSNHLMEHGKRRFEIKERLMKG